MLPLEELTVGGLLERTAKKYPDNPAVWYGGRSLTYRQLLGAVRLHAARLLAAGVRRGCRVGLWAEPEPESVCVFYAIQAIGAVAVMLNTSLGPFELMPQLRDAGVHLLIVGSAYPNRTPLLERLRGAALPACVEKVLCLDSAVHRPKLSAYTAADRRSRAEAVRAVQSGDTAVILFTSGSSGYSKAVRSSHYSRVNGGIQQAHDMQAAAHDRFCVTMPMFHCFCISVNLMAALASGGCLCIPRDRHTASIAETVEKCGCTIMSSVPTMYHALISKPSFDARRFATLRTGIIGGAHYPPEEFVRIERALGPQFTLLSSLGQTETTAGMTVCDMNDSIEVRSRTVGHFMAHVEGKITDIHTGAALPAGSCGEICVRGYLTMQGYCGEPAQTCRALDADGWVHTGDLGVLDEQGNITLKGRLKELIIRGGENISPCEIETALLRLPEVASCKVVGVPDEHYGEEVCACVQPADGCKADAEAILRQLRGYLADYKLPRYLLFWPQLPVTATGKPDIMACTAAARAQIGQKSAPALA